MNAPSSLLHIEGLLKPEELTAIDQLIAVIPFVDGKATATGAAKEVKNNLQAPGNGNEANVQVQHIVVNAMSSSPIIQAVLLPKVVYPPIISKYRDGMQYGWHTDSPVMSDGSGMGAMRIDLSMTVFLSDPESYTGGELVIHNPTGFIQYKLKKGDAIVYPTTKLHCVNPVTAGERVAAVTWMQSMIRDTEKRDLLFQLKTVQESLGKQNPQSGEHLVLQQTYSNLLRMWAEV